MDSKGSPSGDVSLTPVAMYVRGSKVLSISKSSERSMVQGSGRGLSGMVY